MEPPVISFGKLEGQLIILKIIFSHIHMETIRRNIVERFGSDLRAFAAGRTFADITGFHQFFADLGQILLLKRNIKSCLDGAQMLDLFIGLFQKSGNRFKGSL